MHDGIVTYLNYMYTKYKTNDGCMYMHVNNNVQDYKLICPIEQIFRIHNYEISTSVAGICTETYAQT